MTKYLLSLFLIFASFLAYPAEPKIDQPQLIVQIIVDQLRGDLLDQYRKKFTAKGFNYLYAHGIDYHNAYHSHANTVTCAGHGIIATGAYPVFHGLISNRWYDQSTKHYKNCVADDHAPIIRTIRTKKILEGRSPANLMVSTLSDEIVLAKKGRAFAVSLKDRAAIPLAGHAGKAFWFDKKNGGFVTSRHYYNTYPEWVNAWNQQYQPNEAIWSLSTSKENYLHSNSPLFPNRFKEFGETFPHKLGPIAGLNYYKYFSMTPYADESTAAFAIALLKNEKLGLSDQQTDYLGISFSATDAIGHQFGPNSLESEDNLLRLDQTISKLLTSIDQLVGLDRTLIVLTSDHGVSDAPAYCMSHRMPENPHISTNELKKNIEKVLAAKFALPSQSLEAVALPYIYLNHAVIKKHKHSVSKVKRHLVKTFSNQPGIFQIFAIPFKSNEKETWLSAKIAKMAFPKRCGDLYVVPPPYQNVLNLNKQRIAHGSPWQYDSYVPLVFTHPSFKAIRYSKPVNIIDIAPTLAYLLSIKRPSAALGEPLTEVVDAFNFYSKLEIGKG